MGEVGREMEEDKAKLKHGNNTISLFVRVDIEAPFLVPLKY
jgi:hypothetical protein